MTGWAAVMREAIFSNVSACGPQSGQHPCLSLEQESTQELSVQPPNPWLLKLSRPPNTPSIAHTHTALTLWLEEVFLKKREAGWSGLHRQLSLRKSRSPTERSSRREDLSALNVNSIPNFSWTPPLFFQVLGTVYKKVKEIMVSKKWAALNLWNRKLLPLKKRLMTLAVGCAAKHLINHWCTYKELIGMVFFMVCVGSRSQRAWSDSGSNLFFKSHFRSCCCCKTDHRRAKCASPSITEGRRYVSS